MLGMSPVSPAAVTFRSNDKNTERKPQTTQTTRYGDRERPNFDPDSFDKFGPRHKTIEVPDGKFDDKEVKVDPKPEENAKNSASETSKKITTEAEFNDEALKLKNTVEGINKETVASLQNPNSNFAADNIKEGKSNYEAAEKAIMEKFGLVKKDANKWGKGKTALVVVASLAVLAGSYLVGKSSGAKSAADPAAQEINQA